MFLVKKGDMYIVQVEFWHTKPDATVMSLHKVCVMSINRHIKSVVDVQLAVLIKLLQCWIGCRLLVGLPHCVLSAKVVWRKHIIFLSSIRYPFTSRRPICWKDVHCKSEVPSGKKKSGKSAPFVSSQCLLDSSHSTWLPLQSLLCVCGDKKSRWEGL